MRQARRRFTGLIFVTLLNNACVAADDKRASNATDSSQSSSATTETDKRSNGAGRSNPSQGAAGKEDAVVDPGIAALAGSWHSTYKAYDNLFGALWTQYPIDTSMVFTGNDFNLLIHEYEGSPSPAKRQTYRISGTIRQVEGLFGGKSAVGPITVIMIFNNVYRKIENETLAIEMSKGSSDESCGVDWSYLVERRIDDLPCFSREKDKLNKSIVGYIKTNEDDDGKIKDIYLDYFTEANSDGSASDKAFRDWPVYGIAGRLVRNPKN